MHVCLSSFGFQVNSTTSALFGAIADIVLTSCVTHAMSLPSGVRPLSPMPGGDVVANDTTMLFACCGPLLWMRAKTVFGCLIHGRSPFKTGTSGLPGSENS